MVVAYALDIQRNTPIKTWFGIGGGADRSVVLRTFDDLRHALDEDPALRILGDGANLLVDDDGVSELVAELKGDFEKVELNLQTGRVYLGAGVKLPRAVKETVQVGLGGLEVLAGFPATMGGCVVMNAGGKYGEISDMVTLVHAIDRHGRVVQLPREQIAFSYRHSGLNDMFITGVELRLHPGDPQKLAARMREIMEFKRNSQPLNANSAGCCFKNPTLTQDLFDFRAGTRVGAGMLIDRAGLKGLTVRGASVSQVHANFLTTTKDAKARDVIELMDQVIARVLDSCGVALTPEVVVWRRSGGASGS